MKPKKQGCWLGTPLKGYKKVRTVDNKSTLEFSNEKDFVIESFELFATGQYSMDEVRKKMNAKGFKISKQIFINMLRNVGYIGKVIVPESDYEPVQLLNALHPPLISDELFAKVQDLILGRKKNFKKSQDINPELALRGILICPFCGSILTGSGSQNRIKKKYYYYHCQNGCKFG